MHLQQAGRLADVAADFYSAHDDYTQEQAKRVNTALTLHARDDLPDGKAAAVIEHGDGLPLIVVATDTHLYALEVPSVNNEDLRIETRCRIFALDRASIEKRMRYRSAEGGGHSRRSTWRVGFEQATNDDFELTIFGHTAANAQADERELLGRHLAERIGWEFPTSS